MKKSDYFRVCMAGLLMMPAIMLIFSTSDLYPGLLNLLGLTYTYALYRLSFTPKGVKIIKSLIKFNCQI